MSNGFRHFLGIIAGLLLPPVLAALLVFGVDGLPKIGTTVRPETAGAVELYTRLALVVAAAVVVALMAGSRMSPLASFIGGLAFTAAGSVWIPFPTQTANFIRDFPVAGMEESLRTLIYHGMFLFIGVALLAASFPPSRWRVRLRGTAHSAGPYEGDTYTPPPSDEAEVTFRTDGVSSSGSGQRSPSDVPGYRFLPREPRSARGHADPSGHNVTQEFEQRRGYGAP